MLFYCHYDMIIVIILIIHIIIFDIAVFNVCSCCFATVVPDDDGQRSADEDHGPSRSQTPPTPPVQAEPSQSPPPSPCPMRQRAMAQLRPVSVPEIVRDVAGSDPVRKIADFCSVKRWRSTTRLTEALLLWKRQRSWLVLPMYFVGTSCFARLHRERRQQTSTFCEPSLIGTFLL